jgi:hypothetical protein
MQPRTRGNDYLVHPAESIEGGKLPSREQVLGYFLHHHINQNKTVRMSATETVSRVEEFWSQAGIPMQHRQDVIKKIERLFDEWKILKKSKSRVTETQKKNEACFMSKLHDLFDIGHADAFTLLKNQEDKAFLRLQRQKGRPGSMSGVDKIFARRLLKRERKEKVMERMRDRSEKEKLDLSKLIEVPTDSDPEELNMNLQATEMIENEGDSVTIDLESPTSSRRKRARTSIMSTELAAVLDRHHLSDRAATMLLFETTKTVGRDPELYAVNRATIRRERQKYRAEVAGRIKDDFKADTVLTVHWDGKLMSDLTGHEKVERLPILVSTLGEVKLLGIPKIVKATGEVMAQTVFHSVQEWELSNMVRAMCFDTTASNTGRLSGACVLLERLLERPLLHFACRHHILEIVLQSAFKSCFGPSNGPEISIFKRFQAQWPKIDQSQFTTALSDESMMSRLNPVMQDVINFCQEHLEHENQRRDDYRELVELPIIFLGAIPATGIKFRTPAAMHHARWMSKAIYSLKIWLFRSQFRLTVSEVEALKNFTVFIVMVYIQAWFSCPSPITAARTDLQLLKTLQTYFHPEISAAALSKFSNHLWYLSENLVLLCIFDDKLDLESKRCIVRSSLNREANNNNSKRLSLLSKQNIADLTLADCVSKQSMILFDLLGIPKQFLANDPAKWSQCEEYMVAKAVAQSLCVTNDHAERAVSLIQEATNSKRFKKEDQLQLAIQVIEDHRKRIPDAKKVH